MSSFAQTLLGFDFGLRRIGVAVGQTVTRTAKPLTTLLANQGVPQWPQVDQLIKTWQPDALVVGIPFNMDGSEQAITRAARHFLEQLELHYRVPVYGMDERLSTRDARERLFESGGYKKIKNTQVDSVAAQLILESFIAENR